MSGQGTIVWLIDSNIVEGDEVLAISCYLIVLFAAPSIPIKMRNRGYRFIHVEVTRCDKVFAPSSVILVIVLVGGVGIADSRVPLFNIAATLPHR